MPSISLPALSSLSRHSRCSRVDADTLRVTTMELCLVQVSEIRVPKGANNHSNKLRLGHKQRLATDRLCANMSNYPP
jgi:hypothetical protein